MKLGTIFVAAGVSLVVAGAIVRYAPGLFSWFGHLPGDIRFETASSRVLIPLTSMLLVSAVTTDIVNVVVSLLRDR